MLVSLHKELDLGEVKQKIVHHDEELVIVAVHSRGHLDHKQDPHTRRVAIGHLVPASHCSGVSLWSWECTHMRCSEMACLAPMQIWTNLYQLGRAALPSSHGRILGYS
jgi:hypothetical protein